jgi:ubiquinone/menaquinone biosynthesis C-methylase UbiE
LGADDFLDLYGMSHYHPEPYWSDVAKRIKSRKGKNVIAGDDEPYYRYKRKRFLALLNDVDFKGKSILEIGSGPGGNLKELLAHQPASLTGADISADMISLAKSNLPDSVNLVKTNGTQLPFADQSFDYVFTATVLQHNTDEVMLKQLMGEICRVAKEKVYLFERIEDTVIGDELCYGRPVSYYEAICKQHGFKLASTQFINIRSSYYVSGAIRKGLNPKTRVEGEPLNGISNLLQNVTLPVTSLLDKIFTSRKDIGRLEFIREK